MIQHTLASLNRSLDDMLGEPYVPNVTLREIERRCEYTLNELLDTQVLKGFDFTVNLDGQNMKASIEVSLQPRYTNERIRATSLLEFQPTGGDGL